MGTELPMQQPVRRADIMQALVDRKALCFVVAMGNPFGEEVLIAVGAISLQENTAYRKIGDCTLGRS